MIRAHGVHLIYSFGAVRGAPLGWLSGILCIIGLESRDFHNSVHEKAPQILLVETNKSRLIKLKTDVN